MIFWYEKKNASAAEEIKIKLLRLIIVTELGIFHFYLHLLLNIRVKYYFLRANGI